MDYREGEWDGGKEGWGRREEVEKEKGRGREGGGEGKGEGGREEVKFIFFLILF